jgi:hypothetical protein
MANAVTTAEEAAALSVEVLIAAASEANSKEKE